MVANDFVNKFMILFIPDFISVGSNKAKKANLNKMYNSVRNKPLVDIGWDELAESIENYFDDDLKVISFINNEYMLLKDLER